MNTKLGSIGLIEKDSNSDVLLTWAHPTISEDLEKVLISKTGLADDSEAHQFSFSKYNDKWIYIFTCKVDPSNEKLKKVEAFSVCLTTQDFFPEKYIVLVKIMAQLYLQEATPLKLLEVYLSVYTKGKYKFGESEYVDANFDIRKTYLAGSIKDTINLFGEQSVLLWHAMMLKKRIVVFGDDLVSLLKILRAIPIFVWHRQSWEQMRPYVTPSALEIEDLKRAGVFVAGFTKSSIKSQSDLYDLFVDIPNASIQVSEHAKGDFLLTKYHKDLGNFILSAAKEDEQNEQQIIKDLANKTKELIGKLDLLKVEVEGKNVITLEGLQQRKLPPNMDVFLFGVAQCEGF